MGTMQQWAMKYFDGLWDFADKFFSFSFWSLQASIVLASFLALIPKGGGLLGGGLALMEAPWAISLQTTGVSTNFNMLLVISNGDS